MDEEDLHRASAEPGRRKPGACPLLKLTPSLRSATRSLTSRSRSCSFVFSHLVKVFCWTVIQRCCSANAILVRPCSCGGSVAARASCGDEPTVVLRWNRRVLDVGLEPSFLSRLPSGELAEPGALEAGGMQLLRVPPAAGEGLLLLLLELLLRRRRDREERRRGADDGRAARVEQIRVALAVLGRRRGG